MYIDKAREYLKSNNIKISKYAELYMRNNKIAVEQDLSEKVESEFLLDNTYKGLQLGKVYRNLDSEYLEYWMATDTDRIKVYTDRRDAYGNVIGYSEIQRIFIYGNRDNDILHMAEAKNLTYGWCKEEVAYKYYYKLTITNKDNPYIKKVYTDIDDIITRYFQSKMEEPLRIEGVGTLYMGANKTEFRPVNDYPFDTNLCT